MVFAIIVAAGNGIRMENKLRKQYLTINGRPILSHTLSAFDTCQPVDKIYLVIPREDFGFCEQNIVGPMRLKKELALVVGGAERQDSVYNGLLAIDAEINSTVVIHDGVRPFIRPELIEQCIRGVEESGACILGVPILETVKNIDSDGYIDKTIARENLWHAQTPQAFHYGLIRQAHEMARRESFGGTDDAVLVERLGTRVKMIDGSVLNVKITTREDLALARALFRADMSS
ncbi:MAG: 2-C-methyl-D-erythritol 4-phosphate cytidylyltransferase [Desulfobacterales bacterium]|nr:MAG: 2-C-methyl-D-erythritol 4-phosphate cytidylyltransferase [Desulfobacterales bacterium]